MEISFFSAPQDAPLAVEGNNTEILCVWKGASSTAQHSTAAALPPTLLLFQAQGEPRVRREGGSEEDEHCRTLQDTGTPHSSPGHKMPSKEQPQLSP